MDKLIEILLDDDEIREMLIAKFKEVINKIEIDTTEIKERLIKYMIGYIDYFESDDMWEIFNEKIKEQLGKAFT